jgi:hypothetical protein
MRRMILAALAATAVLTTPAMAQTATKAAPVPGYPSKCGWYIGVDGEGVSGAVNGAAPGTIAVGGDVGLLGGYACQFSGIPWFVEGIFDFQNLNAASNGFSLTGPAHLEQRIGAQVPLMQFLPILGFPSTGTPPNLPVLPPGVTVTGTPASYIYVAANEDDVSTQFGLATAHQWLISPELGAGLLTPLKLSNGWNAVADTWAGAELESNSVCLGSLGSSICPKLATRFKVGVSFKF